MAAASAHASASRRAPSASAALKDARRPAPPMSSFGSTRNQRASRAAVSAFEKSPTVSLKAAVGRRASVVASARIRAAPDRPLRTPPPPAVTCSALNRAGSVMRGSNRATRDSRAVGGTVAAAERAEEGVDVVIASPAKLTTTPPFFDARTTALARASAPPPRPISRALPWPAAWRRGEDESAMNAPLSSRGERYAVQGPSHRAASAVRHGGRDPFPTPVPGTAAAAWSARLRHPRSVGVSGSVAAHGPSDAAIFDAATSASSRRETVDGPAPPSSSSSAPPPSPSASPTELFASWSAAESADCDAASTADEF